MLMFVYGTLQSPDVVEALLKRIPVTEKGRLATRVEGGGKDYARFKVCGQLFPGVIAIEDLPADVAQSLRNEQKCVNGLLLEAEGDELELLDWYEDEDYQRTSVVVVKDNGEMVEAQCYIWRHFYAQNVSGSIPFEDEYSATPVKERQESQHLLEGQWDYEIFCSHPRFKDYVENSRRYGDEFRVQKAQS
eukprot:Nk52_evm11s270 gene=Nk52_evmTU11s270